MFVIPANPSEELLNNFMVVHGFNITQDICRFNINLIDNIGQKIYTYPMLIKGEKEWTLRIMNLIVSLRNIKKTWLEEKDYRKKRKIYSKMNCIKGELNRYEI